MSSPRRTQGLLLAVRACMAALLTVVVAVGCSRPTRVEQVERGEQVDSEAFIHEHLQSVSMVTVGEAYRAMSLLADGEDKHAGFEERQADLQSRGIVRAAWNLRREEPIDKGAVAYMTLSIIRGERGVNSLVFGSLGLGDRRYALRDVIHMGLMEPATSGKYVTGGELVFLMGKADAYMAAHGGYPSEKVDLRQELESGTATTVPSP